MFEPSVLIVSTKVDTATDEVVRCLTARGIPHYRLNTEDYPFGKSITFYPAQKELISRLEFDGKLLYSPSSIWYRRMRTPGTPAGMEQGVADFCRHETRATLLGSILGIKTKWISHPTSVWRAEHKPFQLEMAASLGLTIPATVITNDPAVIRDFFRQQQRIIVKPVRTGHVVRGDIEYAIYTSEVLEEHLWDLDSARLSPSIYQQLVEKQYDIRVTIVGDSFLCAAIDSQSDPYARIDWRQTENPKLPLRRIEIPQALQDRLLEFMQQLGLKFGAVDLVLTPSGEYVFLEINPSGQWLWLDDMLDMGISDSIASWLAEP